ncbi:MAG: RDD family protein [Gammaproteobacteria bacterium]
MNTLTHRHFICVAIAALGLLSAAAHAQNAPATAPGTNPTAVEKPDVEAPSRDNAARGANTAADTDTTPPRDTATETDDNGNPIVWTRDRSAFRGRSAAFRGDDDEIVSIGSNSTLGAGQHSDAVVSVFGSSTSAGEVRNAVVSVFGSTRIEGGSVGDAAVAVLGDNYVNAIVDGDVVAVLGDVDLGPSAKVRGNVVVIGGHLTRAPGAEVRGGVQNVMGLPTGALSGLRSWLENCVRYLRPLAFAPGLGWVWGIALGFLGLYLLLALLFREPIDRCVKTLQEHPGQTIVASLLTMLLTPVLFVVLCFTIIGIAFVPIVSFGIFLATLFGKAVVLTWIGRSILKLFQQDEGKLSPAVAVLLGGAIILLLYVVPVIGFLVYNLLGLLALGAVVYTLLLSYRAKRRSSPPPAFAPRGGATAGAGSASAAGMASGASVGAAPYTAGFSANPDASGTVGASANAASDAVASSAAGGSTGAQSGESTGGASAFANGTAAGGIGGAAPAGGYGGGTIGTPPPFNSADALSLPRAGFWIRMLALLVDAILVGVVLSVVVDHHHQLQLIALATYGAIMWKLKGTTVGGIVCNLKVVRVDGQPVDWSTSIVRALGCFLSLVVCGLGFIWIAFDEGRQSWHDKIAGTAVVRVPQGVSLL